MDAEELRKIVASNRGLEEALTKKNEQYIFDLKKSLKAANLSEEELTLVLKDMLPVLVEEQKRGTTARQLFGTVSERTAAILTKPAEKKETTTPLLMWLDNSLLLFGLMTVMLSIMFVFSKGKTQPLGILTILFGSIAGGGTFYLFYKYINQYDKPGADKSKKPGWLKSTLIMALAILVWFLIFAASALLPVAINPVLDPIVAIVLGGIALAVRYYLKKKYNIEGNMGAARYR